MPFNSAGTYRQLETQAMAPLSMLESPLEVLSVTDSTFPVASIRKYKVAVPVCEAERNQRSGRQTWLAIPLADGCTTLFDESGTGGVVAGGGGEAGGAL